MGTAKKAKLRCICCEKAGVSITKEHYWPVWLLELAKVSSGPCYWPLINKDIPLHSCKVPLCKTCNNTLGATIEAIAKSALVDCEAKIGITYTQAKTLVLWLWKFEGLMWNLSNASDQYSSFWTMKERLLGTAFETIADDIVLACATIKQVDNIDRPVGLCSPIGGLNSIFMSGVFCNLAILVTLSQFSAILADRFSVFSFKAYHKDNTSRVFFPKVGFETYDESIKYVRAISVPLYDRHERIAQHHARHANISGYRQPRVELPEEKQIILLGRQ